MRRLKAISCYGTPIAVRVNHRTFHLRVLGGFPSEPLPVGASDLDFPTPFTRGDSPFAPSAALNLPPVLGLILGSAGVGVWGDASEHV